MEHFEEFAEDPQSRRKKQEHHQHTYPHLWHTDEWWSFDSVGSNHQKSANNLLPSRLNLRWLSRIIDVIQPGIPLRFYWCQPHWKRIVEMEWLRSFGTVWCRRRVCYPQRAPEWEWRWVPRRKERWNRWPGSGGELRRWPELPRRPPAPNSISNRVQLDWLIDRWCLIMRTNLIENHSDDSVPASVARFSPVGSVLGRWNRVPASNSRW